MQIIEEPLVRPKVVKTHQSIKTIILSLIISSLAFLCNIRITMNYLRTEKIPTCSPSFLASENEVTTNCTALRIFDIYRNIRLVCLHAVSWFPSLQDTLCDWGVNYSHASACYYISHTCWLLHSACTRTSSIWTSALERLKFPQSDCNIKLKGRSN